ncbi:hypothetical protein ACOZGD_37510 [Streptomyces murinus]
MADDLYQRYQAAARSYQSHADACGLGCTRNSPQCRDCKRLYVVFARLQDAYLTGQRGNR